MGVSAPVKDLNSSYAVPEGKTADEYKALAQKYANKCKDMVSSINRELNGISTFNFKTRAANLRSVANKEPFENTGMHVGGNDYDLTKKNEQICTLIVVIVVLIAAFILLSCYMFMRGGISGNGGRRIDADVTYKP